MNPTHWTDPENPQDPVLGQSASVATLNSVNRATSLGSTSRLALDDTDPLGIKPGSIFRDLPPHANVAQDQLNICNKEFDVKKFLATVHQPTRFREFQDGLERLESCGAQQTEIMRQLVRDHFDNFVIAKATVDGTYIVTLLYWLNQFNFICT
jgi:hypothetical protein